MTDFKEVLCKVCSECKGVNPEIMERVLLLAVEIAREGREGRRIGTIFVVADTQEVLKNSRSLILDPLFGHDPELKQIHDPNVRETIKELAQLDGAFVISDKGVAVSACRYLNASAEDIRMPLGLGARHMAAASISRATKAVSVVVSESSIVRVFDNGEMVSEIIPELWLFSHYSRHAQAANQDAQDADFRSLSCK
jgi:DNA integrity scanning protein DisA with diadenylate cyclase activity